MRRYKLLVVGVILVLLIAALCVSTVSADVQTDESVFKVTSFSGAITSPDGKEMPFTSVSDFDKLLGTPIIAGSQVDLQVGIQLRGSVKNTHFVELSSELQDISWDATPNNAKPDTLWSDFSGTTYLWMPPSHGISQMTISLEGVIPQPVTEESFDVAGATVKRTLIKDIPVQILNVKVKDSTSTFTYAEDPQKFVGRVTITSNVFVATSMSTNSKIIETKEKINEMNRALSDLRNSIGGLSDDETTKSLIAQYEAEKKIAETVEILFIEGYPDIASKIADDVKEDILKTKTLVDTFPVPDKEDGGVPWWYVIIGAVIGVIGGIVIGYLSFGKL
jgi:hypothetical protein